MSVRTAGEDLKTTRQAKEKLLQYPAKKDPYIKPVNSETFALLLKKARISNRLTGSFRIVHSSWSKPALQGAT
jgi:hypothetical protein